jgi:hypothetical protein
MTTTDWIALVQAIFLALAAFLSWRAYQLSSGEHREARAEAAKAPLRSLHADVVREMKELAAVAKVDIQGASHRARIEAQQRRLAVALTFLPHDTFNLFATSDLTLCEPDLVDDGRLAKSRLELLNLFTDIEDGKYSIRQVATASIRAERASQLERG